MGEMYCAKCKPTLCNSWLRTGEQPPAMDHFGVGGRRRGQKNAPNTSCTSCLGGSGLGRAVSGLAKPCLSLVAIVEVHEASTVADRVVLKQAQTPIAGYQSLSRKGETQAPLTEPSR